MKNTKRFMGVEVGNGQFFHVLLLLDNKLNEKVSILEKVIAFLVCMNESEENPRMKVVQSLILWMYSYLRKKLIKASKHDGQVIWA